MELNKAEYTILAQVKIRLKQFHMETVTNEDDTTKDVVVFDNKEELHGRNDNRGLETV